MTTTMLCVLVAALAVGAVLGARFAAASHRVDRLLAAHHRDVTINDAADEPAGGAL